ncbi:MAG: preprotein translocase subunit SecE [Clostridia bacterium]|nr:preprotein translocase subunit SecE [Clostridia bacterium]
MAKNKVELGVNVDEAVVEEQKKVSENQGKSVKNQKSPKNGKGKNAKKANVGAKIARYFREIISELKKVEWPKLNRTKNNPGVWANTGTVVVVVLFFLIIITAFDIGLLSLFKLLVGINA